MAERGGFEPPIALRLCLISSQVHSTGLCHLSALSIIYNNNLQFDPGWQDGCHALSLNGSITKILFSIRRIISALASLLAVAGRLQCQTKFGTLLIWSSDEIQYSGRRDHSEKIGTSLPQVSGCAKSRLIVDRSKGDPAAK
jgi:hypothetical protein